MSIERNMRILVIPDTHFPFEHPDATDFLSKVSETFSPTRVVHLGDEVDYHAISFHHHLPDLPSPGLELEKAIKRLTPLYRIFPEVDLLESNHGSLVYRRAEAHGLPKNFFKDYNQILKAPPTWKWHETITLKLPNKEHVMFFHGKSSNALSVSRSLGMSTVNGHYHTQFSIQKWRTPVATHFAMVSGCLIDPKSRAFAYDKNNIFRPILGCSVIIDSQPKLVLMNLKSNGLWTRKLFD
jgi:hypothetical protein